MKLSPTQERVLRLLKEGYIYRIVTNPAGDGLHYLVRGSEIEPIRKDTAAKLLEYGLIATCNEDYELMKDYYLTEKGKVFS